MTETVIRLASRGEGVTESGRYVPWAAPGDLVTETGVTAGPHRATPPCVHFGACGGCQLQHVDEWALVGFVRGRILGALAGVGITPGAVHPVHLSPPRSRRRASLRAVRDGSGFRLGFNVEASGEVVDLAECHVVTPSLWAAIGALRGVLPEVLGRTGACGVTLTETKAGIDCVLANVAATAANRTALARFADLSRIARVTAADEADTENIAQYAVPTLRFDGVPVAFPPGAFVQATLDGERALQSAVADICGRAKAIADLFCGLGTFALPLSAAARVVAADAARASIDALRAAARTNGRRVEAEHRDLFRRPFDARELARFDAAVLDPPRAGAKAQVAALAASRVPVIAYVSCNPNTFARDASVLVGGGYRLAELWPVGQFRWSVHVELVASFVR